MFHLWRMGDDGQWQYMGALSQSPLERILRGGHTNAQFYVMAA